MRWEISGRTIAALWDATSKICSKQHTASLCKCHQAFSLCKWCSHTVVLTWQQLWRILIFNLSERSDFHMVANMLIVVNTLPTCKNILVENYSIYHKNSREIITKSLTLTQKKGTEVVRYIISISTESLRTSEELLYAFWSSTHSFFLWSKLF